VNRTPDSVERCRGQNLTRGALESAFGSGCRVDVKLRGERQPEERSGGGFKSDVDDWEAETRRHRPETGKCERGGHKPIQALASWSRNL